MAEMQLERTGLGKEFILKPKGYGSQRGFSAGDPCASISTSG